MTDIIPLFVFLPLGAAFGCLLLKRWAPSAAPVLTLLAVGALVVLATAATVQHTAGASIGGGWTEETQDRVQFMPGIALVLDGLSALFDPRE